MDNTLPSYKSIFDIEYGQWSKLLADQPDYRIKQVWEGLYRGFTLPSELTSLPKSLRDRLPEILPQALKVVSELKSDNMTTIKWLLELQGSNQIETVLMRYKRRDTVCVSTQAGCAMGCGFCATGQAGFFRQLTSGEIVEQVFIASRRLRALGANQRVSNVVFMGMGEPLANFGSLIKAIEVMNQEFAIGAIVPLFAWFFLAGSTAVWISIGVSFVASLLVGGALAVFTGRSIFKSAARQVLLSSLAAGVTYLVGTLVGHTA